MNQLLHLLARGRRLPEGWGFPPAVAEIPGNTELRNTLMFLQDTDGVAQLVRWYFGIIRGTPWAWRMLSSNEGYLPSFAHKTPLESPTLTFARDPDWGTFTLQWIPTADSRSLSGRLTLDSISTLELDGVTYPVSTQDRGDLLVVGWPGFMDCRAAVATEAWEGSHSISFRPTRFDTARLIERLSAHTEELDSAGLLSAFLALPAPEEKIAVAWTAAARLEGLA